MGITTGAQAGRNAGAIESLERESTAGIRDTPDARGGACVGDSGVPVWVIVLMSEAGAGIGEMQAVYPQLTAADCAAALNYALMRRAEIDADITWHKSNAHKDNT